MNVTLINPAADESATQPQATERCDTSRFGQVDILVESIIEFPDGLVGIDGRRYALISTDQSSPFVWMQSLEHPQLALPVTNPHRFFKDFHVEVDDDAARSYGYDDGKPADVYVTVTAAKSLADFTANLKAPILIRDGRGHQLINQAPDTRVKAKLFPS